MHYAVFSGGGYYLYYEPQVYRVIRVILESSLECEILRTLRTPSLSDNETLRLCGLRVFGRLGLWHTLGVVLTKFYFSRVAGQIWKIFEKFGTKGFNEVFPVLTGQGNNFEMPHAAKLL